LLCACCFDKRKAARDGLRSECKNCRKLKRLSSIVENKTKDKIYRDRNKQKRNNCSKVYYYLNKDKKKEYDKQYYLLNKDKIINNHKIYNKNKRKTNIAYLLRTRVSTAIVKALIKGKSSKNGHSCLEFLPYSIQELKQHLERQFDSWMTWENYGTYKKSTWNDDDISTWTWQIDHIIPQSKLLYKSMSDKNFLLCWSLQNLRPLSSKQNLLDGVHKNRHNK
jgi:hypothetical protein